MNLKELAELLGLSQTTVSRALNGYPEVSEATRTRVQRLAQAHNYSPNARAKGLATGRAHAIGHVIPISGSHEMVNPVFGDFISGVGEVYAREGYDLMMSVVPSDDELPAYRDMLARSSVDGVVLHAPMMDEPRIALMRELGLPFIVHGRASNEAKPYAWLDVNNKSAFLRASDFLLDLGHRRIALINGDESKDFAHRRREGYLEALAARGLTPEPALMRSSEMTEVFGYQSARDMLAGANPPSAFLAASMITAIGIRRAIEDAGLRMGRDISVVTFDDDLSYLKNGSDVPIFTACRSSVRSAGVQLAEMLLRQIADPSAPPETRLLEVELIAGRSTGPVRV
ncbi:substrate-binding domain-containing protein [Planktotalea arctica]|uniref:substrate-binding domain-containing protein n=1 Tax=Planktotalea arctica TaxID=1481893 RepID=UPI000A176D4B|nr:substrate-binding domain-containing protein [Planktotalea arctica]